MNRIKHALKKIALAAATGLAFTAAHAAMSANGLASNGLTSNGIHMNGIHMNGVRTTGRAEPSLASALNGAPLARHRKST